MLALVKSQMIVKWQCVYCKQLTMTLSIWILTSFKSFSEIGYNHLHLTLVPQLQLPFRQKIPHISILLILSLIVLKILTIHRVMVVSWDWPLLQFGHINSQRKSCIYLLNLRLWWLTLIKLLLKPATSIVMQLVY